MPMVSEGHRRASQGSIRSRAAGRFSSGMPKACALARRHVHEHQRFLVAGDNVGAALRARLDDLVALVGQVLLGRLDRACLQVLHHVPPNGSVCPCGRLVARPCTRVPAAGKGGSEAGGNVDVPRGGFRICFARRGKGLAEKEIGKASRGKEQEKADKQKTLDLLDKFNAWAGRPTSRDKYYLGRVRMVAIIAGLAVSGDG